MADKKKESANVLTAEGIRKLEEELEYLKNTKKQENAERIKIALSFGDISENSEYEEAKNEQGFITGRIMTIESILRNAEVVDDEQLADSTVKVGKTVTLYDVEYEEEIVYAVVGSAEADPVNGKLSSESPIGQAIMGHRPGEEVIVQAPMGNMKYKIVKVERT